jgi:hypothetical protein
MGEREIPDDGRCLMTSDNRALVALVSGRLVAKRKVESVLDRDLEQEFTLKELNAYGVEPSRKERTCGVARDVDGDHYCLVDKEGDRHICLSLYGRLFEGYDHVSLSHFNGWVDGTEVSLYDFGQSDYFIYQLQE